MSNKFVMKLVTCSIVLCLYIYKANCCTFGEFPSGKVSLAKGTFITYTGCESSDGRIINNYLVHIEVKSGIRSIKLDLQPYFIKETFRNNASIVLSSSRPVTWIIRAHNIEQLQNIRIYFSRTSSATIPKGISINPEIIPSDFAGSLQFASQLLNNITLATTSASANYIFLQLGKNFQFTTGVQTCQDLASVIDTTPPSLFISQRLKMYDRSSDIENQATGCIDGFEDQIGETLVIAALLNVTAAPSNPFGFPFENAKPEVNLFLIADQIQQQRIDFILLSTDSIKWRIYQIGFQDLFINVEVSDGSDVLVISDSLSYVPTIANSQYSNNPRTLLTQLKTTYDEVNLFLNAKVPDEITIDFNEAEPINETDYNFYQFLTDSIAFEHCNSDTYMFCLKKSAIDTLKEYSYQLEISNDTACQDSDGDSLSCTLLTSNNLTSPQWKCYEIQADDNKQQVRKYSTEVRLRSTYSPGGDNQHSNRPLERRSLPESPIKRAETLFGYLGSVEVLSCISTPDPPTLLPPNNFSIQVVNNNNRVIEYPTYINHGATISTSVTLRDVPPGMQPFFLSCFLTSSSSPQESIGFQHAIMQIIKTSCPTREGRLFKISARSINSYLTDELALELFLVNSVEPFLVYPRKAILLDNSFLHCQPSLCQSTPASGERPSENTGYPMCANLSSLCELSYFDVNNLINVYPNLYGSPYVSTGKLIFNSHNRPVSSTPPGPTPGPPCVIVANHTTTPETESTVSSVGCDFVQAVYTVWPLFVASFATLPLVYACGVLMFCLLSRCSRNIKNRNISKSNKKRRLSLE